MLHGSGSNTISTHLRGDIVGPRAELDPDEPPRLAVVVDVEEEFDWSAPFSLHQHKVTGNGNLHLIQEICDRFRVQPCYVIDYVAASAPRLIADVKQWLSEGRCDIGAQLHTWITPPHEEVICPQNSYQCNLTRDLEARKMACLTDRLESALGTRPVIFKAGRYGLSPRTVELLVELGYRIDTSVVPYTNYSGLGGGPDFSRIVHRPFWLDVDNRLLEIPVSRAVVGFLARPFGRFAAKIFDDRVGESLHLPGIVSRLTGVERLTLSPEGSEPREMQRLISHEIEHGRNIFTLSMHSSSLVVGGSPYAADPKDVADLLGKVEHLLRVFQDEYGGKLSSLMELHDEASAWLAAEKRAA